MLASTERLLLTHVGSLPRPEPLAKLLIKKEAGTIPDGSVIPDGTVIE